MSWLDEPREEPFARRLGARRFAEAERRCRGRTAAVIGGAMGGLAAAHALSTAGYAVDLFERESYDTKRINCGEAMTDVSDIPLPARPEFGFVNHTPEFEVRVFTGDTNSRRLAGTGVFPSTDGYITDRNVVERRWAEQLRDDGVAVYDSRGVTKSDFESMTGEYDLVVDATGQPSLTSKFRNRTAEYAGQMTAVNADVEGDFSELYPRSLILFENYLGYSWAFPKSPTRANVGIGWAQDNLPDDYMASFECACERNGWPVPAREQASIYTIPRGPSLDPSRTYDAELNVVRVGDAAGIANRFTGKGISQAVDSAYLMAELAAFDDLAAYPRRLHRRMRNEYRLAYIVRGALEDGRPDLLGGVMDAVTGLDVEEVDRNPRKAFFRIAQHPLLLSKLVANRTMMRRLVRAFSDDWEYKHLGVA
ncbi:MAG: NAD(P)/FAD-dependent oxidoreductase [Halobacteriota archaeon]